MSDNEIYAFITTNGQGGLVAEFTDESTFQTITADLEDAGVSDMFCFGEAYSLEWEPKDQYELVDALMDSREQQ